MAKPGYSDNLLLTLLGPLIWGGHLAFVYGLVSLACDGLLPEAATTPLLLAATVGALAIVSYLLHLFWRQLRHRERAGRQIFGPKAGLLLSALSLIAILWTALPMLLVSPCMKTVAGSQPLSE